MNHGGTRWCLATVLVQATWLFLTVTVIFALPSLWRETYAALFANKMMPALTQRILDFCPQVSMGIICLGTIVTVTYACAGSALIVTARSSLDAMQRTLLLSTATWGGVILLILVMLVALSIPFSFVSGLLPSEDERRRVAESEMAWVASTAAYSLLISTLTIWICRRTRRKNVEPQRGAEPSSAGAPEGRSR